MKVARLGAYALMEVARMIQISFADWMISQNEAALSRHAGRLQDEADQDGTAFDYEDLDHMSSQVDQDNDWILAEWVGHAPGERSWSC